MSQTRQSRIHAQTLAELNHCVGTARRDAAYACLCELASRDKWPESRPQRVVIYDKCLTLVQEVLDTTERSSLLNSNPKLGLADKPILHFIHLLQQLLQTINSLAGHVENVQQEAGVLVEHLGKDIFTLLEKSCKDFENHEFMALNVLKSTLTVGTSLIEANSAKRRESFSEDDNRRYKKALSEYQEHYKTPQPD